MKPNVSDKLKRLFFWSIMLFVVFLVCEELMKVYDTFASYWYDRNFARIGYQYESLKQRDYDLGFYFDCEGETLFRLHEFAIRLKFIDLGVDSLRFRDDGIDVDRKVKLLALGDSFVQGLGVEQDQVFTEQIEAMNAEVDVVNAGMAGYTPQQYTRLLKRFLKNNVGFDGVLYVFFAGNDVTEELSFRYWAELIGKYPDIADHSCLNVDIVSQNYYKDMLGERAEMIEPPLVSGFASYFIDKWIVSARYLRDLAGKILSFFAHESSYNRRVAHPKDHIFPGHATIEHGGRKYRIEGRPINEVSGETLSVSRRHFAGGYALNYPLVLESISEAKQICDEKNKIFQFIYLPAKSEIFAEELAVKYGGLQAGIIRGKLDYLHSRILGDMDSLEIEVLDLTPQFRRALDEGSLIYYERDSHLTAEGHRLWAEIIDDRLRSE